MASSPRDDLTIILGSDGFLGRNFARYMGERGLPFHAIGRDAGDLSDPAVSQRVFAEAPKAARILHLVTRQRTGQIQYGIQGELIAINARIHLNVLEAWRLHQPQAKLISTGSSCAFPESDKPIVEGEFQSGPMHPSVRGYGLAKQLLAVGSETYASQYGLRYLHLFLATVYGPQDHKAPERTHFMTGMIDRAVKEMRGGATAFTVWGEPDTVRDLLYVDDQIEAIFAADATFDNQMLNCSSNAPVTIDQSARAVVEALGWQAEITYPPGTFKGASYKTLDAGLFLGKTGWKPKTSLVEGVRKVLASDYGLG
ncbi:Nucleoside-diphosphate-sugar epimerase [Bosea lupini]|jgi:GDP-L-fucose synthase|uniref:Nucleoside-diphosphate-sugar epimerase n=1 Tax=Bosea lupini TaxID=1036779 RepID=A0A1H7IPU9_9HYPH|nr:NAD-dependent epimerase/dehydratase family protein [Bosea lupini]SEK64476.1 Nucleoside-diphosphate-sugar epimerase [Bosea lupini]